MSIWLTNYQQFHYNKEPFMDTFEQLNQVVADAIVRASYRHFNLKDAAVEAAIAFRAGVDAYQAAMEISGMEALADRLGPKKI